MSIDYYVYAKDIEKFSAEEFFKYAEKFGFRLWTEEEFLLKDADGFQPFLFNVDFIDTVDKDKVFLSGFEMYISDYKYIPEEPIKPTFWQKLFGRIPVQPKPSPFSVAVADAKTQIMLNCSSTDSFEIILAYIFGGYFCKCGGVFDDPQTGCFFDDYKQIEAEIDLLKEDLIKLAHSGELCTHTPE